MYIGLVATILLGTTPVNFDQVCSQANEFLAEMVAINTTNPPGNETPLLERVRAHLAKEKIPAEIFEGAPGRGNLLAHLKGNGTQKPILLMAHVDVVGVDEKLWETNPFAMTMVDDYLVGRGVLDDKGMAAVWIEVLLDLKRRGLELERDVVVVLTADEESGGTYGIKWLIENKRELIENAEFAINEGAGARLVEGKLEYIAMQSAEKMYQTFTVSAEGPGGHSSVPKADNAIYRLSKALNRLGGFQFPARLTKTTKAYFAALAKDKKNKMSRYAKMLVKSKRRNKLPKSAIRKLAQSPKMNAMLRTTCVATMLEAGQRENALPQSARAKVNCRVLPGEKHLLKTLKKVVGDPKVKIEASRELQEVPATPIVGAFPAAVKAVAAEMSPGVPVVPSMSAGATDSRHLRQIGIAAYGLKPFPASDEDASRIHGANERLLLTSFHYGCEFLYRTVEELAAVKVEELPEEEEEPEVVDDEDESAAVQPPAIEGPAASSTSVRK